MTKIGQALQLKIVEDDYKTEMAIAQLNQ